MCMKINEKNYNKKRKTQHNMNDLMIKTSSLFGKIRCLEINEKLYMVALDVANVLGYKRCGKAINDHCKNILIWDDLKIGGYPTKMIPEEDVLLLLQKSKTLSTKKKNTIKKEMENLGIIKNKIILESREEIEFLDILENALIPFNIKGKKQYSILNYKIDYYIPSLNIAIEYDENGHKYYSYERHEKRQIEITNKLNCKFIRVTDEQSHAYNVGYVIKEIFNLGGIANE